MKQSDWISVEDRLPRTADYVLVTRNLRGQIILPSLAVFISWTEECSYWYEQRGFKIHDVTYWQPIVLPKQK